MPFDDDLKAHLQNAASISAVVADRISPPPLRDGAALPAVTYQGFGGEPQTDLDGEDGNLLQIDKQINCWASTRQAANALAELVRLRLQTPATTFTAVPTRHPVDVYEHDTRRHGVYSDYSFWYRRS